MSKRSSKEAELSDPSPSPKKQTINYPESLINNSIALLKWHIENNLLDELKKLLQVEINTNAARSEQGKALILSILNNNSNSNSKELLLGALAEVKVNLKSLKSEEILSLVNKCITKNNVDELKFIFKYFISLNQIDYLKICFLVRTSQHTQTNTEIIKFLRDIDFNELLPKQMEILSKSLFMSTEQNNINKVKFLIESGATSELQIKIISKFLYKN